MQPHAPPQNAQRHASSQNVRQNAQQSAQQAIGNENYTVLKHRGDGGVWMLHFTWGKKDFRLFLEAQQESGASPQQIGACLKTTEGKLLRTSRFQYLNQFTWWEYDGVVGHGLALEEIRWRQRLTKATRYVELPKDFLDQALELACRLFDLEWLGREQPADAQKTGRTTE